MKINFKLVAGRRQRNLQDVIFSKHLQQTNSRHDKGDRCIGKFINLYKTQEKKEKVRKAGTFLRV